MLSNENATLLTNIGVEHPETVSEFRMMRDTLNDLMNAVRREERERAIAVLKPFAEAADELDEKDQDQRGLWEHPAANTLEAGHLRAAASYITQANEAPND